MINDISDLYFNLIQPKKGPVTFNSRISCHAMEVWLQPCNLPCFLRSLLWQLQSKTLLALPRQLSKSCMLLSSQALYRMGILPQADGVSVRDRQAFALPKGDVEQRRFF